MQYTSMRLVQSIWGCLGWSKSAVEEGGRHAQGQVRLQIVDIVGVQADLGGLLQTI
jgi:hypothetical protein